MSELIAFDVATLCFSAGREVKLFSSDKNQIKIFLVWPFVIFCAEDILDLYINIYFICENLVAIRG